MGKTVPQARSSDAEGTITIMAEMCTAYSQNRVMRIAMFCRVGKTGAGLQCSLAQADEEL